MKHFSFIDVFIDITIKFIIIKKLITISILFFTINIVFSNTFKKEKAFEINLLISEVTTTPKVSPFCMSIVKGDFEVVKKLIEFGADVNAKSNGMTPVMYAAKYNRVEILKLLIEKKAKLKTKCTKKRLTAMDYAKRSKATDAITVLKKALSS